ncbi:MAG: S-layer homology domain-containing protein [Tissierellia bacterium]|nr:S-layer homology domain-containing protein [Tissierellia bacterium]
MKHTNKVLWGLLLALGLGLFLPGSIFAKAEDRPLYLGLSMGTDSKGNYESFVLSWVEPEAVKASLNQGKDVRYQVDVKESGGTWFSEGGQELISGSLKDLGGQSLSLGQKDLEALGPIDVYRRGYSFRVRYLIDGVALPFSNEIRVGARTSYDNASLWFYEELEKANKNAFIPGKIQSDMKADISREEFTEVIVRVYERAEGLHLVAGSSSYEDTKNPSVQIATDLGLVEGVGGGRFLPEKAISREEMAIIFSRLVQKLEVKAPEDKGFLFKDHEQIAPWALDHVYYIQDYGIILGDDKGNFLPKDKASREEAVVLGQRLYELVEK